MKTRLRKKTIVKSVVRKSTRASTYSMEQKNNVCVARDIGISETAVMEMFPLKNKNIIGQWYRAYKIGKQLYDTHGRPFYLSPDDVAQLKIDINNGDENGYLQRVSQVQDRIVIIIAERRKINNLTHGNIIAAKVTILKY